MKTSLKTFLNLKKTSIKMSKINSTHDVVNCGGSKLCAVKYRRSILHCA